MTATLDSEQFTAAEFQRLTPYWRGYVVYMYGARPDQPNVPDEKNPYRVGTDDHHEWAAGQVAAAQGVQDGEE